MSAVAATEAVCVCGSDHLCGCGCGETLNPHVRRVHELAAAGAKTAQIALLLDVSTTMVKRIKNGSYAPRFVKGHAARAEPKPMVPCANCGRLFRKMGPNHIYCTAASYSTHRPGTKANAECGQLAWAQKDAMWAAHDQGVAEREAVRVEQVARRRSYRKLLLRQTPAEWLLAQRAAVPADGELADLVAEQEQDQKWGDWVWTRGSLDRHVKGEWGVEGPEFYEAGMPDMVSRRAIHSELTEAEPAEMLIREEDALQLIELVGTDDPDAVLRMDGETLDWIRTKLQDAGFAPAGVQRAERDRLRAPAAHSGRSYAKAPLIPGKKTRRQKIEHKAANRNRGNSNRPSQKPRKRWQRESLKDAW